ncbi:hypothetical protein [Leifsonia poae]|uniref:hypothetical protein n=1 Tax=Leifsonia poae TaxID=110933 RepID=UPI001CC19DC6|nr:hypothetical protein [Leifsonia poae]
MKKYTVSVTRDGKWWMVAIPELDGLTQARRLAEVPEMAREYIAANTNSPIESFDIDVEFDTVGAVTDIHTALETIRRDRETAAQLEREATETATALAKALAEEGVPLRDIGAILDVSHQRAHQLVNA